MVQFLIVADMTTGVLPGAFIGAKLLVRMTNKDVRWVFFAILSFLGVEMLLKGLYVDSIIHFTLTDQFIISVTATIGIIVPLYIYHLKEEKHNG